MNRFAVALLALGLLGAPTAEAQQAARTPRVEGETIVLEPRSADVPARFPGLAADLVRIGVDAIVAGSAPAARAAQQASASVPIVGLSADPVAAGLVASLARPGGNITGLATMSPDTEGFQAETIP